jgi:cell division protein FtsI (penicillin-binding protein 3)
MRSVILFTLSILLIGCKKEELKLSPEIENELAKSAYYPTKVKSSDYVVSTFIDTTIQRVAHDNILEILKEYEADHGCVLVMETETGKIRSMVNLTRLKNGSYKDTLNYAVYEYAEPGSFVKTMDLMALLEDKKADTSDVYSSNNGEVEFYGQKVRDSHEGGYGDISLGNALLYSSNTIFAQAISKAYSTNPKQFTDKFAQYGLNKDLKLAFGNTNEQFIPQPNTKDWNNLSLPWMSFGYGLTLSPIKILTYYNAIANNGEMVKPLFLAEVKNKDGDSKVYSKSVLNSKICSESTVLKMQNLMRKVVTNGTGSSCKSDKVAISGKTSTVQINYDKENSTPQYTSGFVGYFPTQKPKYTVLVLVNNPKVTKEFYGYDMAGLVVRKIAVNIK